MRCEDTKKTTDTDERHDNDCMNTTKTPKAQSKVFAVLSLIFGIMSGWFGGVGAVIGFVGVFALSDEIFLVFWILNICGQGLCVLGIVFCILSLIKYFKIKKKGEIVQKSITRYTICGVIVSIYGLICLITYYTI